MRLKMKLIQERITVMKLKLRHFRNISAEMKLNTEILLED